MVEAVPMELEKPPMEWGCCVCLSEIMLPPIKQCKNGHCLCSTCMTKLQIDSPICPICKTASLTADSISRNLVLESMICHANANVVCPSCEQLTPFASYTDHKNVCYLMECPCRDNAEALNSFCDERVTVKDLENHLTEAHNVDSFQDVAEIDLVNNAELLDLQSYGSSDYDCGVPISHSYGRKHGIVMLLKTKFLPLLLIRIWKEIWNVPVSGEDCNTPVKVGLGMSVKVIGPRNFQLPNPNLYLVAKFELVQSTTTFGCTEAITTLSTVSNRFNDFNCEEMILFMDKCNPSTCFHRSDICRLTIEVQQR